jgi:hypothetical protein
MCRAITHDHAHSAGVRILPSLLEHGCETTSVLTCALRFAQRFIFVYGMLIYKLLGDEAQQSFARSWGVSYGMNTASEWKDVVTEAMKGAVILAFLERLYVTRSVSWFEDHIGARRRRA